MSSQPRRRRLEVEDIGDVTVINFVDRKILDEQNIQVIGEQLFGLVDQDGRRKLLLNFGNVEYLSSAALGKLITLNKKLQAAGGLAAGRPGPGAAHDPGGGQRGHLDGGGLPPVPRGNRLPSLHAGAGRAREPGARPPSRCRAWDRPRSARP